MKHVGLEENSSFLFEIRADIQYAPMRRCCIDFNLFNWEFSSENLSFLSSTKATNYVWNISRKKIRQAGNYRCVYRKKSSPSPAKYFRALHWPMLASIALRQWVVSQKNARK